MALALPVLVQPVPPQARIAAVPLVATPEPRARPVTIKPVAFVVGARGEKPKFVCPLTSHPASRTIVGSEWVDELILMKSVAELLAAFVSPPPLTVTVLVTIAGALLATLTVIMSVG